MIHLSPDTTHSAPRRSLFGRLAGAAALGLAGLVPPLSRTPAETAMNDGPDWPGKLTGRHRQVVDAIAINDGFPLVFVVQLSDHDVQALHEVSHRAVVERLGDRNDANA